MTYPKVSEKKYLPRSSFWVLISVAFLLFSYAGPVALSPIQLTNASALEDGNDTQTVLKVYGLKASNTNDISKLGKVLDGLYKTYWQANSIGSWIQADVGDSTTTVSEMDISWRNGDRRLYNFVILLSVDGKVYEEVYRGTSSGKTRSYENYDFPDRPARYVKIVVNGNNIDNYAKISDIRISGMISQQTLPPPPDNTSSDSNEMGVWFYAADFAPQERNAAVDKLIQRKINTIYFSVEGGGWDNPEKTEQYRAFIDYAMSKGMKVIVAGLEDPTYVLLSQQKITSDFSALIEKVRTATDGKIDTFVIDVEPHSINIVYPNDNYPTFQGNEKYYLDNYVRMSKILRSVADKYGVKYIDTIPPNYHAKMIAAGLQGGVNQLSSNSINLMAYQATVEKTLNSIANVRADSKIRLVININVTLTPYDPALKGSELTSAIQTLKEQSLPIGIFSAKDVVKLDPSLFK